MEKPPEDPDEEFVVIKSSDNEQQQASSDSSLGNLNNISHGGTVDIDRSDVMMSGAVLTNNGSELRNENMSQSIYNRFIQFLYVPQTVKNPIDHTQSSPVNVKPEINVALDLNSVVTNGENAGTSLLEVQASEPVNRSYISDPVDQASAGPINLHVPENHPETVTIAGSIDTMEDKSVSASCSNTTTTLLHSNPVVVHSSDIVTSQESPGMTVSVSGVNNEAQTIKFEGKNVLPILAVNNSNYVLVETSKGLVLSAVEDGTPSSTGGITTMTDEHGQQVFTQSIPALFSHIPSLGVADGEDGGYGGRQNNCDRGRSDTLFHGSDALSGATEIQLIPAGTIISGKVEEPPKRKKGGGWPKGKKRKNVPEVNAPKKPATGYVLYAMERRHRIKSMNPDLPFAEVTKVLGQEWSCLSTDRKQKYLDLADEDKKRYINDMNIFQQSDIYQNLLKKKKLSAVENGRPLDGEDVLDSLIDLDDGINDLYCKVCNLYFISVHNKKEHMFGQQHLQAITTEIQKEIQSQIDHNQQVLATASILPQDGVTAVQETRDSQTSKQTGPVNVDEFIQTFLQKNYDRESEIRQLRHCYKKNHEDNLAMQSQFKELQEYENKLEQDIGHLKAYAASLSAQTDALKMVPTLFGVINF